MNSSAYRPDTGAGGGVGKAGSSHETDTRPPFATVIKSVPFLVRQTPRL